VLRILLGWGDYEVDLKCYPSDSLIHEVKMSIPNESKSTVMSLKKGDLKEIEGQLIDYPGYIKTKILSRVVVPKTK
jgi:hypothetical protein